MVVQYGFLVEKHLESLIESVELVDLGVAATLQQWI